MKPCESHVNNIPNGTLPLPLSEDIFLLSKTPTLRKKFMKYIMLIMITLITSPLLPALQPYHEITLGYGQDLAVNMALRVEDSSPGFPLFVQGRLGYIYQKDPGNAELARQIFINDNQGGTIQKYGESYLVAMDLGWKAAYFEKFSLEIILSGLWNHYRANFSFLGNNEAFTVKTSPYGVGLGAAMRLPLSNRGSSLMVKSGMEYYPKALIDSHGTFFYTPDGNDDQPRNDFTYKDADGAINQPEFRFLIQVGILYPVGG
jgi:hypothetical protein